MWSGKDREQTGTPARKPEPMRSDGNLCQSLIISSPHGTPAVQESRKLQGSLRKGRVDGNLAAAPQTQRQSPTSTVHVWWAVSRPLPQLAQTSERHGCLHAYPPNPTQNIFTTSAACEAHFNYRHQVAQVVKNPLANAGDIKDRVQSLGQEDPLEEGMATHSSTLAWRIPRTEEPGRLKSLGSQRVKHDWSN